MANPIEYSPAIITIPSKNINTNPARDPFTSADDGVKFSFGLHDLPQIWCANKVTFNLKNDTTDESLWNDADVADDEYIIEFFPYGGGGSSSFLTGVDAYFSQPVGGPLNLDFVKTSPPGSVFSPGEYHFTLKSSLFKDLSPDNDTNLFEMAVYVNGTGSTYSAPSGFSWTNVTPPTALTGGTSVLNTHVEGETPDTNTLTLGITTELAIGDTITCTYDKSIFAADAAVVITATPYSGAHTAASVGKVLTITAVGAPIAVGSTTFALISNLAANPAAGAVGVSCVSTTDVTALVVTSYTTTADITAPVIAVTSGTDSIEVGSTWTDAGANADGGETVTSTGEVTTGVAGTYTITYSATDAAGNTGTATRTVTVTVADTTAPVITVTSGTDSIEVGSTWVDSGATADGEEEVTATGTVNANAAGTYTITYSATDAAGNTGTATRTVTVTAVQSGAECFLGDTKVKTDQGPVAFKNLTTNHSIGGKRIQKVIKVRNSEDNMIFIRKHSLGKGIPNKNTYIGRNHGIYLPNGSFSRARNLITNKGIAEHSRNPDLIYNVLLDTYGKMNVNGMICETLNMNDPAVRRLLNNSN